MLCIPMNINLYTSDASRISLNLYFCVFVVVFVIGGGADDEFCLLRCVGPFH